MEIKTVSDWKKISQRYLYGLTAGIEMMPERGCFDAFLLGMQKLSCGIMTDAVIPGVSA